MIMKAGARLRSTVCTTEVIVVKAPPGDVEVTCGGAAMGDPASTEAVAAPPPAPGTGTAMGKRYVNADGSLEMLCTKPGAGLLACDGAELRPQGSQAVARLRLIRSLVLCGQRRVMRGAASKEAGGRTP